MTSRPSAAQQHGKGGAMVSEPHGASAHTSRGDLAPAEWKRICASMPIACVDLVPVHTDSAGTVTHVGLILRETPWGTQKWCHVGGRVRRGETLQDAARRHLDETLELTETELDAALQGMRSRTQVPVMEWFPEAREPTGSYGTDPRKHAVSVTVAAVLESEAEPRVGGEAIFFRWFPVTSLPADLWPGSERAIVSAVDWVRPRGAELTYTTVAARYNAQNTLMWQTPALALTAQAFLLTIAMSAGSPTVGRVISSLLAVLISLLSIQLMLKHSAYELADRKTLEHLEHAMGLQPVHSTPAPLRGLAGQKSRTWWVTGLALLGVAAMANLVLVLVAPSLY
ncbi:DUF4916 domain-containing protein [Luteipulveratus halotolerans]|uniref:DUF4916 domain-containing protein n=1 Tax=Luteipulveratus halotolerans TaxID=1631356 RepID=UPI00068087BC|nr:DUF4916 domain-containing protein [Luteipulveratus halotolerans]